MRFNKSDFTRGEISPRLFGRTGIDEYIGGCKTLKNALPLPTGGWCNRPGFKAVAAVKSTGTAWRLVPFVFATGDAYVLEFGNLYVRFYKNGEQIMSAPTTPYEVATPWAASDLALLKFSQSADVLFITHQNYQPYVLSRGDEDAWTLNTYDYMDGPYILENVTDITITPSATTGSVTLTASDDIFSNITGYEHSAGRTLFQIKHWIPAQMTTETFTVTGTGAATLLCGGTWRIVTHGTWTGTVTIEASTDGSTWNTSRLFGSVDDKNYDTYVTEALTDVQGHPQFAIRIKVTVLSSGSVTVDLASDPFEWVGVAKITQVPAGGGGGNQMYDSATATVITGLASATATKFWAEGAWSNYRGYPSAIVFYQDRLCFAGSVSYPNTIWMTKTGNYYSYHRNFPLQDDDGITVNLPTRELNFIYNLIALKGLVATTSAGIAIIKPGESGVLTPTSVNIQMSDLAGASYLTPVIVNERIIYAQAFNRIIRDSGYDYESDGYQGWNLNEHADHIFEMYAAKEIAYQREPWHTLWIVRTDGKLVSLTYTKTRDGYTYGWAVHSTCGGYNWPTETDDQWKDAGIFLSVCTIPGDDEDEVWVVVQRTKYGGTAVRTVEKLSARNASTDPMKQVFLDCAYEYDARVAIENITKDSPAVVTITAHGLSNGDQIDISGLIGCVTSAGWENLNGQRFKVANKTANDFELYDLDDNPVDTSTYGVYDTIYEGYIGKVLLVMTGLTLLEGMAPFFLVNGYAITTHANAVSGGMVNAGGKGSVVQIGLPYYSEVITPGIDFQTNVGETAGFFKTLKSVVMRIFRTYGSKVGSDPDALQEITGSDGGVLHHKLDEDSAITGTPPDLFEGDYLQEFVDASKRQLCLIMRQEDPYPVTVLSVTGEVELT